MRRDRHLEEGTGHRGDGEDLEGGTETQKGTETQRGGQNLEEEG